MGINPSVSNAGNDIAPEESGDEIRCVRIVQMEKVAGDVEGKAIDGKGTGGSSDALFSFYDEIRMAFKMKGGGKACQPGTQNESGGCFLFFQRH
jgi:hypothetical protein